MTRKLIPALFACLALAPEATAQTAPWRFRWQSGQILTYRVEQTTSVEEVVGERKTTVANRLHLTKHWRVRDVDAAGTATLELSLAAMRNEITRPGGEVLLYDSANPDTSTPELREQLGKYVGGVLAVLRVDARGQVVEVKESRHGPASRYESDPPFKVVLPEGAVAAGGSWSRAYKVTLEPPAGTGEKHDAAQQYAVKGVAGGAATVTLTTDVKLPESPLDQVPLLQSLPAGEVVFDAAAGLMKSAKLRIDKELKGHQGEGSGYRFVSTYSEEYAESK